MPWAIPPWGRYKCDVVITTSSMLAMLQHKFVPISLEPCDVLSGCNLCLGKACCQAVNVFGGSVSYLGEATLQGADVGS